MPDTVKTTKLEESTAGIRDRHSSRQSGAEEKNKDAADKEVEAEVEVENVERPVDLYKVLSVCVLHINNWEKFLPQMQLWTHIASFSYKVSFLHI